MTSYGLSKTRTTARIPLRGGVSQLHKQAVLNRIRPAPLAEKSSQTATISHVQSPPYTQLHLGLFEIGKALGKGKFGRVYLARHWGSGYICALKVLNKDEIAREEAEKHVRREIEVHSNLRHPGVLGFYGWFHDSRRIFLILEYAAGGELYRVLQSVGRFSERRAAKYIAQVALSLDYLHGKNVMHRDMKPENILLGLHGELKLADFGYSVHSPSNRRETLCGTLDYLPPEMLQSRKESYTRAVDQWTLGVLTYEFLTGKAPFEDSLPMTRTRILKRDMKPLPSFISPEAKDFVDTLLVLEPSKRLPIKDVLHHPWIVKNTILSN
ncbi:serine/threonine-protein kinase [Xylaria bambusicola]|uniref:serine/threonine-protein kinase n=1 Tax=Xylaria bambusicola TaxID=326684 RepID=UPI0020089070|nr:serine/threonine-protein kinase [Xylaria bambusicola]KAI0505132.1 serine/threonine-protein kinase [Xylaria bambusicola]